MASRKPEPHGGLNLGDIPPPDEDNREPNPYEDLFDTAIGELEAKKIKFSLEAPKVALAELPADPTTLGQALFDYYSATLQHWDWIAAVNAELEGILIPLEAQLRHVVAELRRKYKPKDKDDPGIILDEEYIRCNTRITKIKTQLKLLDPQKSSLYKRMQFLSRLVEGVKMGYDGTARSETFGKKPYRGHRGDLPTDQ